jgi:hypothetical protein
MLQIFTYCTFPQAKECKREVRSLTLFSMLAILTLFTRLLRKSPRVLNYFKLAAILRSIDMQPLVFYLLIPLHLLYQ